MNAFPTGKRIAETVSIDENGRMKRSLKYTVTPELAGLTVREFLQNELHFSRRQISSLKYREEGIRVNGVMQRVTFVLRQGDILEIVPKSAGSLYLDHGSFTKPPEILYEDGDLLIVNKPSGMVCHPSHGHYADTLANQVAAYCASKAENWTIRLVGRLDKDTSGVVIFAKNSEAAALISQKIRIEKHYTALAEGCIDPPSGVIDLPIAQDESVLGKMKISTSGKPAETHYEVLRILTDLPRPILPPCSSSEPAGMPEAARSLSKGSPCCNLLTIRLVHGRTHQIRLHLASIGHPLIGDPLYGNGEKGITHAMLHCRSVRFPHPFTGTEIFTEAPFPEDWSLFCPL